MPGVALALVASAIVGVVGLLVGAWPLLVLIPIFLVIAVVRLRRGPPDPQAGRTRNERENARAQFQASRPPPGTTGRPESGEG